MSHRRCYSTNCPAHGLSRICCRHSFSSLTTVPCLSRRIEPAVLHVRRAINDSTLKVRLVEASFSWKGPAATLSEMQLTNSRNTFSPVRIGGALKDDMQSSLKGITLDVKRGELVLVTGPPGSGKSTLVQAISQDSSLYLVGGSCYLGSASWVGDRQLKAAAKDEIHDLKNEDEALLSPEPVGYVPQEAWLCGGTIRENIIFGDVFHLPAYNAVVKACELQKDFESWPQGDLRVIDEGGLDLSGGQRMRINIARAIYVCKMHQFRVEALGTAGEEARRSRQAELCKGLLAAVRLEAKDNEEYQRFKEDITSSDASKKLLFTPLLCLDECFNSLDITVAGNVFYNLFGPGGLLEDCAVLACINASSLLGLLRQRAIQAAFRENEEQSPGNGTVKAERLTRMKVSICQLVKGAITWKGGVRKFLELSSKPEAFGEATTEAAEDLPALRKPHSSGAGVLLMHRVGSTMLAEFDSLEMPEKPRSLALAEHGASGRVRASSYFWYGVATVGRTERVTQIKISYD